MNDDEPARKTAPQLVGGPLDSLSVDELTNRIALLESEIVRLRRAIEARHQTRNAAEAIFGRSRSAPESNS